MPGVSLFISCKNKIQCVVWVCGVGVYVCGVVCVCLCVVCVCVCVWCVCVVYMCVVWRVCVCACRGGGQVLSIGNGHPDLGCAIAGTP